MYHHQVTYCLFHEIVALWGLLLLLESVVPDHRSLVVDVNDFVVAVDRVLEHG